MEFRNIVSYTRYEHEYAWDADGSPLAMQDIYTEDGYKSYDISQTTEELQLRGTTIDDRLEYVVGAYYQKNKPEGPQGQAITAFNGLSVAPTNEYTIEQETYAPYAQGTYSFDSVDGLRLTAGVRYTKDKVEGTSESGAGYHEAELDSEAATWTIGLDYKLEKTMIYGKISRGYKAGGFSATAVTPELYTFDPEYVLNYEIGQKSDFSIGKIPARFNSSMYFTDYKDMQRGGIDTLGANIGSAIFTAGSAEIFGVELEATADLFEDFRFTVNYAYTDAKYNEFEITVRNNFTPQLDCSGQLRSAGQRAKLDCAPFQYTPEHQASATASYNLPVPEEAGQINASITYAWTDDLYSSSYSLPEAEPGAWIDSYGLLNASVSWWGVFQSNFDVSIFGTNLTDEEYRVSNSNVFNLAYYRASIYGEPRMYGARLSYSFQ
jgi:iron complex outermembrane receptor protein